MGEKRCSRHLGGDASIRVELKVFCMVVRFINVM